jgi:hypothetical protein
MSAKAYYGFACGLAGGGLRAVVERLVSGDDAPSAVRFSGTWVRYADGSEWIVAHGAGADQSPLATRIALFAGAPVELVRIRLDLQRWDRAEGSPDDPDLPDGVLEAHCFEIRADGTSVRRDDRQAQPASSHGDESETLEAALWSRIEREGELERVRLAGYLVPDPSEQGLSPRLVELRDAVRRAGAFEVSELGGRITVRVVAGELRRIAVVTSAELQALVEATGIRPTGP